MNTAFERTISKEEWLTPKHIIDALSPFQLDPCASEKRPWETAKHYFTEKDNGLLKSWFGLVWCNPPYGPKTGQWLEKLKNHGNGIALIFARTETKMFFSEIWEKADCAMFLKGRLIFCDTNGKPAANSAGAPSVLVGYGPEAFSRLHGARLEGMFIDLCSQRARQFSGE